MTAMSLGRTETALGAFYRRVAYRVGKANAITATARKLAILVYRTLKDGLLYHDPGAAAYDAQHRLRVVRRLRQRAANLGFSLVNRESGETDGGVGGPDGLAEEAGTGHGMAAILRRSPRASQRGRPHRPRGAA
jgi:hypothetical protein